MQSSKRILGNFFSITFGRGLALLINLISFAIIGRKISIVEFGTFSLLIAISGILSKIIDFGISPIVFREQSKYKNDYNLLNTAITLRVVFFLVGEIFVNIYMYLFNIEIEFVYLFNIIFMNILFSSKAANIRDLLSIPYKSRLKMVIPSATAILDSVLFLLSVIFLDYFSSRLLYLSLAYVLANLPGFVIQYSVLKAKYRFSFNIKFEKYMWLLKQARPLAGFVIMMAIFQQLDLIILDYLKGSEATGLFSIAIRLSSPLVMIPTAVVTTVFPIIVREEFNRKKITTGVYKLLFIIPAAITAIWIGKQNEFIALIFGEKFLPSATITSILLFSQVFFFLNFFTLSLFTATEKQTRNFYYSIVLVAINFALDILLITQYSIVGAAIAKLVATIVGTIFIFILTREQEFKLSVFSWRNGLWVILAGAMVYLCLPLHFLLYILFLPIMLLIITMAIKYFSTDEMKFVRRLI